MVIISKEDYEKIIAHAAVNDMRLFTENGKTAGYLILSLMDRENPVLNSFRIDGVELMIKE